MARPKIGKPTMTPAALCGAIIVALGKLDLEHVVAVVAGELEIRLAHARFADGMLDGYIAVSDSPAGLVIATNAACDQLDAQLADALDRLTEQLGGRQVMRGAA